MGSKAAPPRRGHHPSPAMAASAANSAAANLKRTQPTSHTHRHIGRKAAPPLPGHHPSPAMAAAATADDPFRPIDISSDDDDDDDDDDDVIILGSSNRREEMQIQQATLLPLDPTTIPSSSGTAVTGASEGSIRDRKGRRKPRSELALFPVASSRSLSKPKRSQVIIDLDGDSLPQVIHLDDDDCSLIFLKDTGTSKRKLFDCTICTETVPGVRRFPIAGCAHAFCVSCVRQYIAAKVEENVLAIGCPEPGCNDGTLEPEACRDVIPPLLFQRWGAALCEMALGELKLYCPFKDCSALLVDDHQDGDAAITDVECPHCSRVFCAQCKVPWHDGVDCAEFQRLGEDERGREDLLLRKFAEESKWRRCSKCKMYVERVEGCVYIACRCGHRFCYLCGSAMVKGNHHCSKCKRTW